MNAQDTIRTAIATADMVCQTYLDDLSDEEMMNRPHPQCNHLKWQVGHLISSDHQMIEGIRSGSMPALPSGFMERYSKEAAASNDPNAFDSKQQLMAAAKMQRDGLLNLLSQLKDEDLDQEGPESMRDYAPTVGAGFSMIASHWLMHAGQWVIVRRQLGKEIKI